ncbi:polyprenyl synthetase family protein [Brachybacterium sp. DNPG3]
MTTHGAHSAHPLPAAQDLDRRLVERIEAIQSSLLLEQRERLRAIAPETTILVDSLEGYLVGGKLLRPRFCFWAGAAALGSAPSEERTEALARAGAAIELVQAAALMHDDVIDHSPMRRGRPALHIAAAEAHRTASLGGSPEEFGVATAIVLGDLSLTWAEQVAARLVREAGGELRAEDALRGLDEFDLLRTEVMSGQYLDILHQAGGFRSTGDEESAALSVIRWKTVPYTVLRPVRIGAALMGASGEALEDLAAWAVEVGTAFQLRDDLLSVVGDVDATGKPLGGDIVEGKRTVLLARTLAAADDAGRALIGRTVGDPAADPEQVAAVHALMVSTGAVASVAQDVRERARRAEALLTGARGLTGPGVEGLARLAAQATDVASLPV